MQCKALCRRIDPWLPTRLLATSLIEDIGELRCVRYLTSQHKNGGKCVSDMHIYSSVGDLIPAVLPPANGNWPPSVGK